MAKKELGEIVSGVVIEKLPNAMFRVLLDRTPPVDTPQESEEDSEIVEGSEETTIAPLEPEKEELIAYLAGKMKYFRIRVIVGDKVDVLIDPYGGRGRVVKRR
jgi:translation initiation factor IF-1